MKETHLLPPKKQQKTTTTTNTTNKGKTIKTEVVRRQN
jgi:hypothetical protein